MKNFFVVSLSLIMICLLCDGCSKTKEPTREIIRPVRYHQVSYTTGKRSKTFSGSAESSLESTLSFKIAGTLSNVFVEVGDTVEKKAPIATLDKESFRLKVQEARAGLEQAEAQAVNAALSYRRVQRLYESDSASKSDLDTSRAAKDSAAARVRSIKKKLELANLQLSYTTLRAPFGGAVSMVSADVNENVRAGQPVVVLSSPDKIEVTVAVSELLISAVKQGAGVTVTVDAIPDKVFHGSVSEVGVASTRFATTYPVTVAVNGNTGKVKPGMVARVTFAFGTDKQKRLTVPSHAVMEDRNGRFVFIAVPKEDTHAVAQRVAVSTGQLVPSGIEILEGLSDGDYVVTAGISKLSDGMKVKLLSENGSGKG